jgi:FKBP-type peptidyl-prolyl cis-trans isomerase
VLQEGSGDPPVRGASVEVHITTWLRSGSLLGAMVWNSRDDGVPHRYRVDETDLIPGMVESLLAMRRGERRWILVPSSRAYGSSGYSGQIPPSSDLVLDLELAGFARPSEP